MKIKGRPKSKNIEDRRPKKTTPTGPKGRTNKDKWFARAKLYPYVDKQYGAPTMTWGKGTYTYNKKAK